MQVERTPQGPPGEGSEPGRRAGFEAAETADPTAPRSDPARLAAADVERLLSQASGLRRIVRLAERVAGDDTPGDEEVPSEVRTPVEPVDLDGGTAGGAHST